MKILLMLFFSLIFTSLIEAQTFTEKYNTELQRTDYFDLQGTFLGYSKENMKYNRVEYFDSTGVLIKFERQSDLYLIKLEHDLDGKPMGIIKWNALKLRYDVLDSSGTAIGYYRYKSATRKMEYILGHF
jgi:hypothetical protein